MRNSSVLFPVVTRLQRRRRSTIPIAKLKGWTPVSVKMAAERPLVHWGDFGDISLSHSFFNLASERFFRRRPPIRISGFDALEALHERYPGLEPNGFIFHVSHCGSTLLSNVLGAVPRNLTISEPEPLDDVLHADVVAEDKRLKWFRAMVSALGQKRLGIEENYFIKFNSWALLSHSFIRAAYPKTPWVCIYRHPVEVIVAQLKRDRLNTYFLKDKYFTGLPRETRVATSLVEAMARMLGRYYDTLLAMAAPNVLLVNYSQLSDQTYARIIQHLGLTPSKKEWRTMIAESKIYSKSGERKQVFKSDTTEKQREANSYVRQNAETWAMASYERLEDYRISSNRTQLFSSGGSTLTQVA